MRGMIDSNLIYIKPKEHYVALKQKTHYYLDNIKIIKKNKECWKICK